RLFALDCERIPKPISLPVSAVEAARAQATGAVCAVSLPGLQQVNLIDLRRLLDRRSKDGRRA
ncbi:MAG TPA: chemotaxis protein CheW, partial [Myxococcales bacterium]|nr:chemotaxis protein CheW [Myxococcales bacterium]